MTFPSRADERRKFSQHRAALLFSTHIDTRVGPADLWHGTIDEGTEPAPATQIEARRNHIRAALMAPRQTSLQRH